MKEKVQWKVHLKKEKEGYGMQSWKRIAGLFAAAFALGGCAGGSTPDGNSEESQVASEIISESSSTALISSQEAASSEGSVIENESTAAEEAPSQSDSSDAAGGSTRLNDQEAALIERATARIEELTGYSEGEQYLYIIEGVDGSQVNLSIRENGEQAASALGFYRYDDETGQVQEMDVTTGEYVDFPASQ